MFTKRLELLLWLAAAAASYAFQKLVDGLIYYDWFKFGGNCCWGPVVAIMIDPLLFEDELSGLATYDVDIISNFIIY